MAVPSPGEPLPDRTPQWGTAAAQGVRTRMIQASLHHMPLTRLLAQIAGSSRGSSDSVTVVMWAGILIVAVVGGGFIVMAIRRGLFANDGSTSSGESGLMLDGLRRMRKRGEISDEEYEAARDALTSGLTGKRLLNLPPRPAPSAKPPDALVAPPGFDLTGAPLPRPRGQERPAPQKRADGGPGTDG